MDDFEPTGPIYYDGMQCFCYSEEIEKMKTCKYYEAKEDSPICKHHLHYIYNTQGYWYCESSKARNDLI